MLLLGAQHLLCAQCQASERVPLGSSLLFVFVHFLIKKIFSWFLFNLEERSSRCVPAPAPTGRARLPAGAWVAQPGDPLGRPWAGHEPPL